MFGWLSGLLGDVSNFLTVIVSTGTTGPNLVDDASVYTLTNDAGTIMLTGMYSDVVSGQLNFNNPIASQYLTLISVGGM